MPSAVVARSGCQSPLDPTQAPTEPTGQATKEETDCTKQRSAGHRLSRCVGGLRHLLLGLIYCLPILMGIWLNLGTSILHSDVLRTRNPLGSTFPRFSHLLRSAGGNRTSGSNTSISQRRRLVPR